MELIVECSGTDCEVNEWVGRFGRIKYRLPMINALVVEVPEDAALELAELRGVSAVFENTHITAQAGAAMRSARQAAGIDNSHTQGLTGHGVTIAILDTGVAPVADFVHPQNRLLAFADFINDQPSAYDDNGHGTQVPCLYQVVLLTFL